MKCKTYITVGLIIWFYAAAYGNRLVAQSDSSTVKVERELERILEGFDLREGGEDALLYDQFLRELAEHPINLNTANMEALLQIPGMNLLIARSIIDYRDKRPFEHPRDLLEIKGIGPVFYSRIQPFVSVGAGISKLKEQYARPAYWVYGGSVQSYHRIQTELQERKGFQIPDSAGGYIGNPVKFYHRYAFRSKHASLNVTQEKDAGEALGAVQDFDFTSGHVALYDNGKLRELVIGDYSMNTGQGLVFWTGGAFGKGRDVTDNVIKNERGLRPYSSAQETNFFRGVALTLGDKLQTTIFYSKRLRSATMVTENSVRYPNETGLHRTLNELSRKNNLTQITSGFRVVAKSTRWMIGVSGNRTHFSLPVVSGAEPYERHAFEGKNNAVGGIDFRGVIHQSNVFGELAGSKSGGMAYIAGLNSVIDPNTELSLAYRNYQGDFHTDYGNAFGESSSGAQNEKGFYTGLRHKVSRYWEFGMYIDQFVFPDPRYGEQEETKGYDWLFLVTYEPYRNVSAYAMIRSEQKEHELMLEQYKIGLEREGKRSGRFQLEVLVNKYLRLRSRVELNEWEFGGMKEQGFLMYQDVRISAGRTWQLDGRLTFFDTDGYRSRIYQFENDLLYVMTNTMLQDEGQRAYVLLRVEPFRYMQCWLKYGISLYENKRLIGSGLGEIIGDRQSMFSAQLRLQFPVN